MREEFETEKQKIIQEEVENAMTIVSPRITRSDHRLELKTRRFPENPIVLNKCAPSNSNQRFQGAPEVVRRRHQKREPSPAKNLYEIKFLLPMQEEEEIHKVQEEEETLEVLEFSKISDTNFEITEENVLFPDENLLEEASGSDDDYKPPIEKKPFLVTRKRRKKNQTSKNSNKTSVNKIVVREPVAESTEDQYFNTIDDSEDLDENGEKKIFRCAFDGCLESFARRQACKTHFYNHLASKTVTNGYNCQFCQKTFKVASGNEFTP